MEKKRIQEQVRNDYLSGQGTHRSLAERYGCSASTIGRMIMGKQSEKTKRKATRVESWVQRASGLDKAMPAEVSELQEELLMARLKIELLESMIDIADEQMGANIRKKAGTRQSKG